MRHHADSGGWTARTARRSTVVGVLVLLIGAVHPAGAVAVPETCGMAVHRGDHRKYTEDSLNAMKAAIADGADYLELDVRPDADGTLYLMHDKTVDRTTNGTGTVASKTNEEMRALRLNDGQHVPTLRHVYRVAESSSVHVLTEMKEMGGADTYSSLARLNQRFGMDRVVVTSFDTALLDAFHQVVPEADEAVITRTALTPEEVAPYGAIAVQFTAITDEWLNAMPYPVYAFTPNDTSEWEGLAPRVRAIITNHPARFLAYRETACVA